MSHHVAVARRGGAALTAIVIALATAVALLIGPAHAAIVATVPLATSANYSVLAGTTATNTGPSVLAQSLGVSPGSAAPGFTGAPNGTVGGTTDLANAESLQAQSDLTAAYDNAAGRPLDGFVAAGLLGGLTLPGGVYAEASKGPLDLTGTVTLDAAGDPSTVFIFQTNSTLITAPGSTVSLINGAQECNVFWQVGSSATLDTGSTFVGNILALTSITVNDSVTVHGRALARNGAVTLINDVFTSPTCATSSPTTPTTPTTPGGGTVATPTGDSSDATPGSDTPGSGSGTPDVPSIAAPPRTGGGPLSGETFPWPAALFAVVIGAGGTVALVRNRQARLRGATPIDH